MKKIIIILVCYLVCFNLYACSDNGSQKAYIEEVDDETVINNMTIKKHIITAEYQKEEGVFAYPSYSYLNALIKFPQVSNMKDISTQEKINKQLKEVAMQSLNNRSSDETLKLFHDIVNENNETSEFWGGEIEYKILYVGDKYISLNYEGNNFFGGANPSHFSNYVTISLNNSELIPFTDYFSKDSVIRDITSLKFEWIEGRYTGGYAGNEPEVIDEFVKALKQLKDVDTEGNIYNSTSTYNFAIDEQFAYMAIPFDDSLDGYIHLKFNLDSLN
ncbi:PdaC/SigV domain-containing protein [Lacrimispora brassicae]